MLLHSIEERKLKKHLEREVSHLLCVKWEKITSVAWPVLVNWPDSRRWLFLSKRTNMVVPQTTRFLSNVREKRILNKEVCEKMVHSIILCFELLAMEGKGWEMKSVLSHSTSLFICLFCFCFSSYHCQHFNKHPT